MPSRLRRTRSDRRAARSRPLPPAPCSSSRERVMDHASMRRAKLPRQSRDAWERHITIGTGVMSAMRRGALLSLFVGLTLLGVAAAIRMFEDVLPFSPTYWPRHDLLQ